METKAHHILVGLFTALFAIGIVVVAIWLMNINLGDDRARFRLVFDDSVAGLNEGASVRVTGIEVGQVESIALDPEQPGKVDVAVKVRPDLELTEDAYATLESLGITGATYVALHPGPPDAAPLPQPEGEEVAQIPTRPSGGLSAVMESVPKVVGDVRAMVDRVANILSEDRMRQIDRILDNVAETTAEAPPTVVAMREAAEQAGGLMAAGQDAAGAAQEAAAQARDTFRTADTLLAEDVRPVIEEARAAAADLSDAAASAERLMNQARPDINRFTDQGLTEFRYFISEARRTADELRQLAERLQENPDALLFGQDPSGFVPEAR